MDELDRADVQAAGGLRGDQDARVADTSRAITTFCWLPPDSAERARRGPAAADVELLSSPAPARRRRGCSQPQPRERLLAVVVQREVLGEVNSRTRPRRWRSSGCGPCRRRALSRAVARVRSSPPTVIAPAALAAGRSAPRSSSRLAVAVDPGDADDLAGSDVERDAADGLEAAVVLRAGRRPSAPAPPVVRLLLHAQEHLAPDHRRARPSSVAPSRGTSPPLLPRRRT